LRKRDIYGYRRIAVATKIADAFVTRPVLSMSLFDSA